MMVFIASSRDSGRSLVVVYLMEVAFRACCVLVKFDIIVLCLSCVGVSLVV
jgi:hypothetical protein